jgi:hypothetical protein
LPEGLGRHSKHESQRKHDDALAESFVATLKTDCFADSIPPTKAAAKLLIFDYSESFYNLRRRHSALGYRSPAQFEAGWLFSQREGCSGGGSKGGETCLTEQVGSSRLCCEQLCKVGRTFVLCIGGK